MRSIKQWIAGAVGFCLLGGVTLASAAGAGVENVTFSGFLTAGASYAAHPVLPDTSVVSVDGGTRNAVGFEEDSRFGLQIAAQVNPQVSVTGQLLAKSHENEWAVTTDWGYIQYRASDHVSVRAGRVKLPSFLISDYAEVGYAYPWVRPPQEMYGANPMTGLNGMDMLIRYNMGNFGLLVQPFYGNNTQTTTVPQAAVKAPPPFPNQPAGTIMDVQFSCDGIRGLNLSVGSDIFTVRGSWFKCQVFQSNFGVKGDDGSFSSVGATMDWKNFVIYTEGFIRVVEGLGGAAFPNQEGGYFTFGYRIGKFLPNVTYGWLDPHVTAGQSPFATPLVQRSVALGLRYELGRGADLKFEALRAKPEEGNTGLYMNNPNDPTSPYRTDNVMIYSASVDVVF